MFDIQQKAGFISPDVKDRLADAENVFVNLGFNLPLTTVEIKSKRKDPLTTFGFKAILTSRCPEPGAYKNAGNRISVPGGTKSKQH